jgi:hypothetical protein
MPVEDVPPLIPSSSLNCNWSYSLKIFAQIIPYVSEFAFPVLMSFISEFFNKLKLSAEGQKKMMRIVAKEVTLDMLSPHMFRLSILWENGIAVRPDVALI